MALSDLNVVRFADQSASQEPTIFAGQPAGFTEGLLVGSGHENLDRLHLRNECTVHFAVDLLLNSANVVCCCTRQILPRSKVCFAGAWLVGWMVRITSTWVQDNVN